MPAEHYVTSHQAAKLVSTSPSAVLNWIDDDLLPAYRTPGGHRRVERGALIRFLRDHGMPIPRQLAGVARLLVVDDDKTFLRNAKRLMARRAPLLNVETADSSMDALLKIGIFRPDAVLVDAKMPGIDGVELCRRLQSDPATEHVTIVAISGRVTSKLESAFVEAGAVGVLTKPLDTDLLLDVLGLNQAVVVA